MNKKIIVKENQLKEYIERKKAEKIFNSILYEMNENSKNLRNSISLNNANQTIIEKYKIKKQLTPRVQKLLENNKIINNKGQII